MLSNLDPEELKENTNSSNNKQAKKIIRKPKIVVTNTDNSSIDYSNEDTLKVEDSNIQDEIIRPKNRRKRNSHRFTVIKGTKPGTDRIKIIQTSSEEEDVGKLEFFDDELTDDVSEKIALFEEKSFLSNADDYNDNYSHDNSYTENFSKIIDDSITEEKFIIDENSNGSIFKPIKDDYSDDNTLTRMKMKVLIKE